ncbi:ABC transporter ATP-binding protein [Metamycoplasma equirhinis]|uniref:ABC transporter ATP-binding protein n=1 Tax=Metamycoplasma equirhinis TaxID=92402 RepID=A0ABZ0PBC1_9BACT|nr:ABC transporter ATP-binding protein [Metamycoplasma equirhinis]TPD99560.1 ABC transporter ATP-binding protein [Metamycoplasma equirhinis]WPB53879.1 ABC transporter ATP-binding protein [Metamycoplasma equirhinis]
MLRLYKYLDKRYKWLSFVTIFLTSLQVISFLLIPILVGQIVGLVAQSKLPNGPQNFEILRIPFSYATREIAIKNMAIYFVFVLLFGAVSSIGASILASYISNSGSKQIRSKLWAHIGELSQKDIEAFTHAKILTRFTIDISRIQFGLVSLLRMLIIGPSYLIFGLVFAFLTNLNLSIILAVMAPVLAITMIISGSIIGPIFKKEQKMHDKINNESQENILGIRVIKSYNLEQSQLEKFDQANENWRKAAFKSWFSFNLTFNFISIFSNLTLVFIIYIAGITSRNITTQAEFTKVITNVTTFTNYVIFITIGVVMLSFTIFNIFRAKVSAKRVLEILNKVPDIKFVESNKKITNGLIEFDHVSFRYYDSSENNVLENISFKIKPGEILGIIGPTGSGKSTIAKLLNLDFKIKYGNIKIDGHEITEIDTISLRESISHVYQVPSLLSGTIKSNFLLANPNANDDDMIWAAKNACAFEYINRFNDKFEHEVNKKGTNLSGGQKQRLSIAQGLIRKPKILILDDSTSALDANTEKKVRENIRREFSQNKISTLIISQKISSIIDADKIIVLNHGQIIGSGSHSELMKTNDIYREIALSQGGEND